MNDGTSGLRDPHREVGVGDTVLVTGAAGVIGRVVVLVLAGAGMRVVAADRVESGAGGRVLVGDMCDARFVAECLDGVDAVVHLAAIPAPGQAPEEVTLAHNVQSAYLVLDGAGRAGLRTAVAASSASAYGYAWAERDLSPPYAPIDEAQPCVPIDSYGLSKVMTEEVGAFATRRWGIPTTLLRFPFVGDGERLANRLAQVRDDVGGGRSELWTWLDTRDAARAVLAVLTSGLTGHHVLNIAAPDSSTWEPAAALMAKYHPETSIRGPLEPDASLFDTTLARDLLGFVPAHGWRGDA
ncbi:NAD(P)-dependent oxidoreductase [Pseudonocardia aurantiaca]